MLNPSDERDTSMDGDGSMITDDLIELRRLVDRYGVAMDSADPDVLPELFLPGGTLVVLAVGREKPLATFTGTGPDGIGMIAILMQNVYQSTMHSVTTHEATVCGNTATGTTYCVAYHVAAGDDGNVLETLGVRYYDRFVRTADGWRFEQRDVTRLWTQSGPASRAPLAIDRAAAAAAAASR
jgi:hypothetical protein